MTYRRSGVELRQIFLQLKDAVERLYCEEYVVRALLAAYRSLG
jgi:hypothetical protein